MRTILPLAAAGLLLSACADTAVQPEVAQVPEASFAKEQSGNPNNAFTIGQGWSMTGNNGRGWQCMAFGYGDADDFLRADKRGGESVHFKEVAGTMRIWRNGVLLYDGEARVEANWYYPDGYGTGLGSGSAKAFATFETPDGPGITRAICALQAPRAGFAWATINVW